MLDISKKQIYNKFRSKIIQAKNIFSFRFYRYSPIIISKINFKPFSFHLINKLMYELRIADPYIHRCQITNLTEH